MRKINCLSKKDLILLYYEEFNNDSLAKIRSHLKHCKKCFKKYLEIEKLLSGLEKQTVELSKEDISSLVESIIKKLPEPKQKLKLIPRYIETLSFLKENLAWRFRAQPQLAFISLALIFVLFLSPVLLNFKKHDLIREFAICEIEMELSLQNLEIVSVFDFFEEEFIDQESFQSLPILHNNSGIIRLRT